MIDIIPYHNHVDTHTDGQEARRRREMSLLQRQRKSISKWVGRQLSTGLAALAPCVPSALTSCLPSLPRAESWVVLDLEGGGRTRLVRGSGMRTRKGTRRVAAKAEVRAVGGRRGRWWSGWRNGGQDGGVLTVGRRGRGRGSGACMHRCCVVAGAGTLFRAKGHG